MYIKYPYKLFTSTVSIKFSRTNKELYIWWQYKNPTLLEFKLIAELNTPIARTLKCDQHTWRVTIQAWLLCPCTSHQSCYCDFWHWYKMLRDTMDAGLTLSEDRKSSIKKQENSCEDAGTLGPVPIYLQLPGVVGGDSASVKELSTIRLCFPTNSGRS